MEYNTGKKPSFFAGQSDLLIKNIKGYIETRVEIAKLEARSEGGNIISLMVSHLGYILLGAFGILFLLTALALFVGRWVGYDLGFLIVGVFFLVVVVIYLKFFITIEKHVNVFIDNQLKAISERENAAEEAMEDPETTIKTPIPSETVIQKPTQRKAEELKEAELNHLELEDNEDLRPVQMAEPAPEFHKQKTVFAPKPGDAKKENE